MRLQIVSSGSGSFLILAQIAITPTIRGNGMQNIRWAVEGLPPAFYPVLPAPRHGDKSPAVLPQKAKQEDF